MSQVVIMDIFCSLIILLIMWGINLQGGADILSAKRFKLLLWAGLLFVVIAGAAELAEGKVELSKASFIINLMSFYSVDLMMFAFLGYLDVLLGANKENAKLFKVIASSVAVSIIATTFTAITGSLFAIEGGHYVEKELVFLPYIISLLIMLEVIIVVLVKRKSFDQRQFNVVITYLIIPIISIVLELKTGLYALTAASVTLSLLIIYIFIQVEALEAGNIRANVLEEISTTDMLTGLKNRRAYYNYREGLAPEDNVGIVFCDINGLKYTNDHFGHGAGDDLIRKFAGILTSTFRSDECFRISGDEFIMVLGNIPEQKFNQRVQLLEQEIAENNQIAAFGYAYGSTACIDRLCTEAEEAMYLNKRLYSIARNTHR